MVVEQTETETEAQEEIHLQSAETDTTMTADDFIALEALLDKKLEAMSKRVQGHDDDIKAFKAIFGAAMWLGGTILALVVAFQNWMHK